MIKQLDQLLALWRDEKGKVCCMEDRCCHRGASLSCRQLVNGPVVTLEGDLLTFYVKNVIDEGKTVPQKPDEISAYDKLFRLRLQFHFPNIWQNFISDKIRAFAAFVPVDKENSIVYIRYYERIVRVPILREFFNWIEKVASLITLRQDKRVVETQLPVKSENKMDERLIIGDKPIIEY